MHLAVNFVVARICVAWPRCTEHLAGSWPFCVSPCQQGRRQLEWRRCSGAGDTRTAGGWSRSRSGQPPWRHAATLVSPCAVASVAHVCSRELPAACALCRYLSGSCLSSSSHRQHPAPVCRAATNRDAAAAVAAIRELLSAGASVHARWGLRYLRWRNISRQTTHMCLRLCVCSRQLHPRCPRCPRWL